MKKEDNGFVWKKESVNCWQLHGKWFYSPPAVICLKRGEYHVSVINRDGGNLMYRFTAATLAAAKRAAITRLMASTEEL